MGDFESLKVDRREGVATIWLNRPERRNAMNPEMARELIRVLEALGEDGDVRALVLRGSGGHFCSGGDLTPGGEPPTSWNTQTLRSARVIVNTGPRSSTALKYSGCV